MRDLFGSKPINQLDERDLNKVLKEGKVPEGFFIEYKKDFPQDFEKYVASLANTHGGWIFIGVDADNPDNVPESFPGIAHQNPKERFKDICITSINPMPFFQTKIIDLEGTSKEVLVAYVEESAEPPHFTRDGCIYRRLSEGSTKVRGYKHQKQLFEFERWRHVIDELYQKAEVSRAVIEEELSSTNITADYFGLTLVIHPYPV